MAKAKFYYVRFTVRGSGNFPIDMLRYEQCWPTKEEDVHWMSRKDDRELMLTMFGSHAKVTPTKARWESFGWTVTEVYPARG